MGEMQYVRKKDRDKTEKRKFDQVEADLKKNKKLGEEEKLLAEREEFHCELDINKESGEEKEQDVLFLLY